MLQNKELIKAKATFFIDINNSKVNNKEIWQNLHTLTE